MTDNSLEFIQYLVDVTPLLSAQLLIVLLLRHQVLKYFGAKTTYLLWLLPPLWCITSWSLNIYVSTVTPEILLMSTDLPAVTTVLNESFVFLPGKEIVSATYAENTTRGEIFWPAMFYVWLSGFLISVIYLLLKTWLFHVSLRRSLNDNSYNLEHSQFVKLGFPGNTPVHSARLFHGPALYGIWKYRLLLPEKFNINFDQQQQDAMLAHELVHFHRHDNRVNLLALLLRSLFWFNPIFYIAFNRFRLDQELSCDAHVLENSTTITRQSYGKALLCSANGDSFHFELGVTGWGSFQSLKERTIMLNNHHKAKIGRRGKFSLLGSLILLGSIACSAVTLNTPDTENSSSAYSSLLKAETIPAEVMEILNEANRNKIAASMGTLPGIPADSDYIAFVIDTSGSMYNTPSWNSVQQQIAKVLNLYPELKGFQIVNDMGDYIEYSSRGSWMVLTVENKSNSLSRLKTWHPYSNSNPVEGIKVVVEELIQTGDKTSIYIIGDDLNSGQPARDSLELINQLNTDSSTGAKLARIHNITMPTLFRANTLAMESANNSVDIMRSVTQQNDGTFEIIGFKRIATYRVVRGDYLSEIAQRYGVGLAQLKTVNKLRSNRIQVGQNLVLPGGGSWSDGSLSGEEFN